MSRGVLDRLLEIPAVYSLVQRVLLPGQEKLLGARLADLFRCSRGLVLDVGCGPQPAAPVPDGTLVGIDVNLEYVRKYTLSRSGGGISTPRERGGGARGCVGRAENLPFADGVFDECRCAGALHHLPAANARMALKEMLRCLRTGGRIVIFDSVMPDSGLLRPLAWMMRKLDRGDWVRNESELTGVIHSAGTENWRSSRFTYTFLGLEGMTFVAHKGGGGAVPAAPV